MWQNRDMIIMHAVLWNFGLILATRGSLTCTWLTVHECCCIPAQLKHGRHGQNRTHDFVLSSSTLLQHS